jgi:hypothetical protein
LIEAASPGIANNGCSVAKTIIGKLSHGAERIGRGDHLTYIVVSKTLRTLKCGELPTSEIDVVRFPVALL